MPDELARARELESTVEKIKDVIACRVVFSDEGEIEEIHVLARSGRSPRYIVRDIESAILAACGVTIDRRKISIAQLGQEDDVQDKGRPVLTRVSLTSSQDEAEMMVDLSVGKTLVSGNAKGIPTPNRWLKLAAEATLDALSKLLSPRVKITLHDVTVAQSKSARIALVTLTLVDNGQQVMLSGSCPVTYDERESVVRATLDAINRKFPMLLDK
ncbi:MAG: hypothetical protein WBJ77_01570 [Bacillota bacterium]